MHNLPNSHLFDTFADDLLAERSARPLIIIGTSKIEDLLCQILKAYFLPKISKVNDKDELLEGDTPLSTLSARIKICFRLGIIDISLYKILDKLRDLRNLCAHGIAFDANKSPARDHIAELKKQVLNRNSYQLTKKRYFANGQLNTDDELQCLLLTLCVILEAILTSTKRTIRNRNTLRISSI